MASPLADLSPAYLHVVLNHLPIEVLGAGLLVLFVGLLVKNRAVRASGLALMLVAGLSGYPVFELGEAAEHQLKEHLDQPAKDLVHEHEERAETTLIVLYVTAAASLAGLVSEYRKGGSVMPSLALVIGMVGLGLGMWTAEAGGHIMHREFREPASSTAEPGL